MKALMIATEKLPVPPIRGGAIQTYAAAVAPLLARGNELTILGVTDPGVPTREKIDGALYVRVPGDDLDIYATGIAEHLVTNRYNLIHIFNRPRLVRTVREMAPHARIILSMHNDMFGQQKIDPAEAAYAVEQVERIVTVSDYVGKEIAGLHPQAAGKLRTIYSGVDLTRFTPPNSAEAGRVREALRTQHNLQGRKVILFVGRLSPKKGADILVRAMNHLACHRNDAALVLVGSKWYGEDQVSDYVAYVRALSARSPVPVITTGFVPQDQVHHWFWAGDLFVCASQWEEPLARVHYEAMAAGLPIVTTARGGNPEVVRGTGAGLVVENAEDPAAFAASLSTLLTDSGGSLRMGLKGRQLAETRFGWDRVAREIREVWGNTGGPENRGVSASR